MIFSFHSRAFERPKLRQFRRQILGAAALFWLGGCAAHPEAIAAPPVSAVTSASSPPRPKATTKPIPSAAPKAPHKARIFYGISTKRRVFALTFDDGPDPRWTPQVLAILKKWHAPATFFMVGKMVRAHPSSALAVQAAHFPIGNHTWGHPRTPRDPQSEVARTDAILEQKLGIKPTLFRPPYGIMDNGLARVALARGEDVIDWNSLGADWDKGATSQTIAAKVIKGARPGGICLLHDGGGNRSHTIAALPVIIDTLRRRGYRFVTVPELMEIGPPLRTKVSLTPRPKPLKRHRAAKTPTPTPQTP